MRRKAMVTGGSEGIGLAFCRALAARGMAVTAVARRAAPLRAAVASLPGAGHKALAADLGTARGLQAARRELARGGYGLLVNNAGFGLYRPFHELPAGAWHEMTRLNIDALLDLSHAFLLKAEPGDALVNVSSNLAFLPYPDGAVYAASKAFVTSLSESLWRQNRARGVFVLALHPGSTATGFHRRAFGHDRRASALQQRPDQVVRRALAALDARRGPSVTSGWHNAAVAFAARFLSRRAVVSIMGRRRR